MSERPIFTVYSLSDSTGQTAETLSKAAIRQFRHALDVRHSPLPRLTRPDQLAQILTVLSKPCMIAYTLSIPALKEVLEQQAPQHGISLVNLLDPLIQTISQQVGVTPPRNEQGMMPELDEEYFRRIEAVEFAIKLDDGKDPKGMEKADIILVGVSRTSKTPTCMYLAQNYGMKVANNPLVYNVAPPKELFTHKDKCIGLKIRPEVLHDIRTARLHSLGLPANSSYANFEQIQIEMDYASRIIAELGCPVVDVSHKAIEETASEIMYLRSHKPLEVQA